MHWLGDTHAMALARCVALMATFLFAVSATQAETIEIPITPPSQDAPSPATLQTSPAQAAPISTNEVSPELPNPQKPTPPQHPETLAKPTPRKRPGLFNSVHTTHKVVALTFDDGPHGTLTPKLLDLLQREGIHATFFVLGSCASVHPELLQRMTAEGHEVANHSWNHPRLTSLSPEKLKHQIQDTMDIIEKTTGRKNTLMRPPYGLFNERIKTELTETYGLDIILWSVDPLDWKRPGPDVVARRLVNGAHPGAILLVHDIHPGTITAMPKVIAQLRDKGYSFTTVSELLAMDEPPTPTPTSSPVAAERKQPREKSDSGNSTL